MWSKGAMAGKNFRVLLSKIKSHWMDYFFLISEKHLHWLCQSTKMYSLQPKIIKPDFKFQKPLWTTYNISTSESSCWHVASKAEFQGISVLL